MMDTPNGPQQVTAIKAAVFQNQMSMQQGLIGYNGSPAAIQPGLNLADLIPVKMGAPLPQALLPGSSRTGNARDAGLNVFGDLGQSVSSSDEMLKAVIFKLGNTMANMERSIKSVEDRINSFNIEQRDMNRTMYEQQVSFAQLISSKSGLGAPTSPPEHLDIPSEHGPNRQTKEQVSATLPAPLPGQSIEQIETGKGAETSNTQEQMAWEAAFDNEDAHLVDSVHEHNMGANSMAAVFQANTSCEDHGYNVMNYYKTEGMWQAIARSARFDNLTLIVVIFNAVYIGIDSDRNDANNLWDANWSFIVCTYIFCVYFTVELFIRFMAFKNKVNCCQDGWFMFDLFLVSTMILDSCILTPILKYGADGREVKVPTQPLRMLRLFKITRMARLMKVFPELITVIRSMNKSVRAGSSTAIVVIVINYVWGIVMHMLLRDRVVLNTNLYDQSFMDFSTVPKSMWILFMDGTLLLDNSAPLMTQLLFSTHWMEILAGIAFVVYMCLSAQVIMQTLVGMLVDVVSSVNDEAKTEVASSLLKQELLEDLREFSGDDNRVSHSELMQVMASPKSRIVMKKLGINAFFLYELQKTMYSHNHNAKVPIKKILELMMVCRGDEQVTVDTMARGLTFICQDIKEVKDLLKQSLK